MKWQYTSTVERLDIAVAKHCDIGRALAVRMIVAGEVMVNGRKQRVKSTLVQPEDLLEVRLPALGPKAEQVAVDILHDGNGFVVVNKPAYVPVHPYTSEEMGTVANALAQHYDLANVGEQGLRGGVVHRLDVMTSGCLVFAYKDFAWQGWRDAFTSHAVSKRYTAWVQGTPQEKGNTTLPLAVKRHKPAYVGVVDATDIDARMCDLSWQILETNDGVSKLDICLGTGFLHQIRATFAYMGHPLLGDTLYGAEETGAQRPLLHARELSWQHNGGGTVHAPLPLDMKL